jgi:hypothetical protein
MTVKAWISPARLLNIEEKSNDDNTIKWFEGVVMVGTDVNTITIDKSIAPDLESGKDYDFELQISENLKTSKSGQVFKTHKFKIIDFESRD